MIEPTSTGPLSAPEKLAQIAAQLNKQESAEPVAVRELLRWFDAQRRGLHIVRQIRKALAKAKLKTKPDFEGAYLDGLIEFVPSKDLSAIPVHGPANFSEEPAPLSVIKADPTYRIGKLHSANRVPLSVNPNQTITEALTIMLANDFSQLPVMVGEREFKGIVSWASIGRALALGGKHNDTEVRECMDPARYY